MSKPAKPAWTWADYHRQQARDKARADRANKTKPIAAAQFSHTADSAGGCEGRAPEGSSGGARQQRAMTPANARQPRDTFTPPPRKPKISLAGAVSMMEQRAASWRKKGDGGQ